MDKHIARTIADAYLEEMRGATGLDLCFNLEITEEHEVGYVFFYNTRKYWETKDFSHSVAGNGPILIRKIDGELVVLPSNQSVERSLCELPDAESGSSDISTEK